MWFSVGNKIVHRLVINTPQRCSGETSSLILEYTRCAVICLMLSFSQADNEKTSSLLSSRERNGVSPVNLFFIRCSHAEFSPGPRISALSPRHPFSPLSCHP